MKARCVICCIVGLEETEAYHLSQGQRLKNKLEIQ